MFAGEPTILPIFELDGKPAEEESYNLTSSDLSLCGGNEVFSEFLYFHLREHLSCCQIDSHFFVDKIFTDGFLLFHGKERPYSCVDFALDSNDQLKAVGLFCGHNHPAWQVFGHHDHHHPQHHHDHHHQHHHHDHRHHPAWQAQCPLGAVCLQKCCRTGSLLFPGSSSKPVCREGNRSALWDPEDYQDLQIHSPSFFFKTIKNVEVCYEDRSEYKIQPGGLFSISNQSVTPSFCIDNLWDGDTGRGSEVVITQPENCHKDIHEGPEVALILFSICSVISLLCLVLTFIVYWFLPGYQHLKGKIVLVNVTFTSFLCGFLLLSYFTKPSSFFLNCASSSPICKFIEDYICAVIGYHGYFIFIATFTWVTIFGFNLYWSVHRMLRPDEVDDRDFGFSVQLSAGPGMSLLVVLLLVLQDLASWPLGASISPHRAAFATLVSSIFWLLLLLIDLSWTMTRPDAPAMDSDNTTLRIAATVGLGVPLLLTGVLAVFHISLPSTSMFNPRMGEQEKCFLSSGPNPIRILLLYHLPILLIILVNLVLFSFIVWEIVKTKSVRHKSMRDDSQHRINNYRRELRKQLVLYAKLFLVFGITWSLEPLSIVLTSFDVYNIYTQVVGASKYIP